MDNSLLASGAAIEDDFLGALMSCEDGSVAVTHCLWHMLGLSLLSSKVAGRATDNDAKQSGMASSAAATGKKGLTIKEAAVKLQHILNGDPWIQQNACIAEGPLQGKMICQLVALICNLSHVQGT